VVADLRQITSVGTLLNGTYRLERVLAEGGMGVVYEAQHLRLPRRFAVKVMARPRDARIPDAQWSTALMRFRREAEIAATLSHPHIVEVVDFQVSEGGSPYLVMELLTGEDLSDRLRTKGRLPAVAALRIITEVAEALDCAHQRGVVHRDIKPSNIFLTKVGVRDDFVKVLDFGVSKLIDSSTLTQERAMVGTPLYMSPEQAVGSQDLTAQSDLFSLASIAYEALTGRRAFGGSSIPSILYQIVHGPTPTLAGKAPGLNDAVDRVFARALAKRRSERFARATEFAAALAEALGRASGPVPLLAETEQTEPPPVPSTVSRRRSGEQPVVPVARGDSFERAPSTASATGGSVTAVDAVTHDEALSLETGDLVPLTTDGELRPPTGAGGESLADVPLSADSRRRARRLFSIAVVAASVIGAAAGFAALRIAPSGRNATHVGTIVQPVAQPIAQPLVQSPPPVAPAPSPVAPAPSPPPVEIAAPIAPAPTTTQPDPPAARVPPTVQFVFHVVPRDAQITVDGRPVRRGELTLPRATTSRRVKVSAPGHRTLSFTAPANVDRTFELRLERTGRAVAPSKRDPVERAHESAPVQEL
jgi:serine/threonine-protein kinase